MQLAVVCESNRAAYECALKKRNLPIDLFKIGFQGWYVNNSSLHQYTSMERLLFANLVDCWPSEVIEVIDNTAGNTTDFLQQD